jgi:hypothetical protein
MARGVTPSTVAMIAVGAAMPAKIDSFHHDDTSH